MASLIVGALGLAAPGAAAPLRETTTAGAPSTYAYRVVLDATGGFANLHQHWVVVRSDPGTDVARLFGTVSGGRFRALRPSYLPANPCCDRFTYRLSVSYRHGRTKTVTTMDGTTAPPVLWKAINLVRAAAAPAISRPAAHP
jgi:hypothetical protein